MHIVLNRQATSKAPDLDLPFAGGELVPTGGGWTYSHEGRSYRLTLDDRRGEPGQLPGTLEAWAGEGYYCGSGDWSLAVLRHEAVRLLSRHDVDIEKTVARELFTFRMAITILRVRACLKLRTDYSTMSLEELDDEIEREVRKEEEVAASLLVVGLERKARAAVIRVVKRFGGRCYERRST